MIDYELVDKYLDLARSAVEIEGKRTLEDIMDHLKNLQSVFKMNESTFEELTRRVLEHVNVSLDEGDILQINPNSNWFVQTRVERGTDRFDAYEKYLEYVSGYPNNVIITISNSMDKVMNSIGDPLSETTFSKKVW